MKKLDLLAFSFLPTVAGIVLLMFTMMWPESEIAWSAGQGILSVMLIGIWWFLGKWCARRDKSPWNGFALLQWWGIVNFVFSFFHSVDLLSSFSQMYANCMGIFLFPFLGVLGEGIQLPLMVLLTFSLTSAAYLWAFTTTRKRVGVL